MQTKAIAGVIPAVGVGPGTRFPSAQSRREIPIFMGMTGRNHGDDGKEVRGRREGRKVKINKRWRRWSARRPIQQRFLGL